MTSSHKALRREANAKLGRAIWKDFQSGHLFYNFRDIHLKACKARTQTTSEGVGARICSGTLFVFLTLKTQNKSSSSAILKLAGLPGALLA